jgi:phosphotransferase system enzyme I (PtsP)
MDAVVGNLYVEPTAAVRLTFDQTLRDAVVEVGADRELLGPCKLASGEEIRIMANVGLLRELPVAARRGADGVGLYRTEFTYLVHRNSPTEATQLRVYERAFEEFPDRPITFRTLDLGGDKAAAFMGNMEHEDNPFLGLRSIRLSLAHPEIFRTQLRALLRACHGRKGKGRLLFPMISSLEEMRETLRQVDLARAELRGSGVPFAENLPIGVMIEVPAAVEIISHLVKTVQFLSVGTNDLLQFTVAADRGNRQVAELASKYHPALFSMLSRVAWEAIRAGVPLSICGEMAADPACALYLAGLQTDTLSMDSRYVERTKALLRQYTLEELREYAGAVRKFGSALEIRRYLHNVLRLPGSHEKLFEGIARN